MTFWFRVFMLLVAVLGLSACGKSGKLSVKADPNEKDQPSTALVRKVEISYRDPGGKEQMREAVAAYGMGQPISVDSEKLKDLDWDEKGSFEARAYSGDGLLLLRGESVARKNDSEEVEVVLSRTNNQAAASSAVIRAIRIDGGSGLSRFRAEGTDLRAVASTNHCLALPVIAMPSDSGLPVQIVFEGTIKAPSLKYEIAGEVPQAQIHEMKINGAGDAVIELRPSSQKQTYRIFSKEYEGCLDVETKAKVIAPVLEFKNFGGEDTRPRDIEAELRRIGALVVHNPNDREITITVRATVSLSGSDATVPFLYQYGDNPILGRNLSKVGSFDTRTMVPAHSFWAIRIYGAVPPMKDPGSYGLVIREGLSVRWSVTGYDGDLPISEAKREDRLNPE
jgi:hypothetical protein